jgi:fatty acid desaturase
MIDPRGTILRFTADRTTVTFVICLFALQFLVWYVATPLVAVLASPVLLFLCVVTATINHNHQHVNVFKPSWLNRIFDLPLALQSGMGPYSWVLHHNLGHHLNYLHQPPSDRADESRWTRRDGTAMGQTEYTLVLFLTHPIDIYRVGKKHPKIYRRYLLMRLPLYALLGALLYLNPINTLIVFLAVPCLALLHTCRSTYEHHAHLDCRDPLRASYNRLNPFYNFLSHNLGYHTAHHMRPGLHWSMLPAYHAEISAGIPDSLIHRSFWASDAQQRGAEARTFTAEAAE